MQELINYCPVDSKGNLIQGDFAELASFLQVQNLQGCEVFLYENKPFPAGLQPYTKGVHLRFWPSWLNIWRKKAERSQWLAEIKANLDYALALEPEYLVWHVAHVEPEEIYDRQYAADSATVLAAAQEVVQALLAWVPPQVTLLLENLWWPGLNLLDQHATEAFLGSFTQANLGIILDTGHLSNTNLRLTGEAEEISYLVARVQALGSVGQRVAGMHVSSSLAGSYVCSEQWRLQTKGAQPEPGYIYKVDQHRPFSHPAAGELLSLVHPEWLVHELYYDNFAQLAELLASQRRAFNLQGKFNESL